MKTKKITVHIDGTDESINNALAQLDKLNDIDYGCDPIEDWEDFQQQQRDEHDYQRAEIEVEGKQK